MTDNTTNTAKRKPEYVAYAVRSQQAGPSYTRIGVGFTLKNGGISVLYDAIPLSGQIVLLGIDADKPATLSYGAPTRKPDYEANMVRDGNNGGFWTEIGAAYRQDGYVSILLDVVPHTGKIVLSQPRERN